MARAGRKPVSEKKLERFLDEIKGGSTVKEACGVTNISETTIYKYLAEGATGEDPMKANFRKRFDLAEEAFYQRSKDQLKQNLKQGKEASLFFYMQNKSKGEFVNTQYIKGQMKNVNEHSEITIRSEKQEIEAAITSVEAQIEETERLLEQAEGSGSDDDICGEVSPPLSDSETPGDA